MGKPRNKNSTVECDELSECHLKIFTRVCGGPQGHRREERHSGVSLTGMRTVGRTATVTLRKVEAMEP